MIVFTLCMITKYKAYIETDEDALINIFYYELLLSSVTISPTSLPNVKFWELVNN